MALNLPTLTFHGYLEILDAHIVLDIGCAFHVN